MTVPMLLTTLALTAIRPLEQRTAPAPVPLMTDPRVGDFPGLARAGVDVGLQQGVEPTGSLGVEGALGGRAALGVNVALGAGEPELGLEGRVMVLQGAQSGRPDLAVGARYKQHGFRADEPEMEGFLAAGLGGEHGLRLTANLTAGTGLSEPEKDAELGLASSLRVRPSVAVGLAASGRVELEGDEEREAEAEGEERGERRSDLTAGPYVSWADGGRWTVTGLAGVVASEQGVGGRGVVVVQGALGRVWR